jgi:heme exporter protein D
MDGWDVAILAGASYLAVTILVRFMTSERNKLLADFQSQIEAAQARQREEKERETRAKAARSDAA